MNFIRLITWYTIGIIAIILEFILRMCLTPIAIIWIIILTALGCKSVFDEDMKPVWKYALIWHLENQFHLSGKVIDYLNPNLD